MIRFFRILTNCGTSYEKTNNRAEKERCHSILFRSRTFSTYLQHLYDSPSLTFKVTNFSPTVAASQTDMKGKGAGIFIH